MRVFRGLFAILILLPLAVIVVVFAIHNRDAVAIDLWPLTLQASPPLFVLVLGVFLAGFLIGGTVAWLSGGRSRGRARKEHHRLMDLERDVAAKKQAEAAATTTSTGLPAIAKS